MISPRTTRPPGLRRASFRRQIPWFVFAVVVAAGLVGLAALAGLVSEGGIDPMDLLADPAEVTGIPWYIGAVSDLNLFVWAAGAALFFLAALGLRRIDARLAAALALLGAMTMVLVMDDRFLLHEIVFPWLFGISEEVTYAVYAVVLALIVLSFLRVLLRQPELTVLVLALVAFAASVALDVFGGDSTARRMVEEGAKLLGTAAWAAFPGAIILRHLAGATGKDSLRRRPGARGEPGEPVPGRPEVADVPDAVPRS